jgi:hypothetical protein
MSDLGEAIGKIELRPDTLDYLTQLRAKIRESTRDQKTFLEDQLRFTQIEFLKSMGRLDAIDEVDDE